MVDLRIKVHDGFSRWLGNVGRMLGLKGREAEREISSIERPAPQDEAEMALYQAMGWMDPEGEDALAVVRRGAREVMGS